MTSNEQWQRALSTLRRRGSEADKQALLRKLRETPKPLGWRERVGMWWERLWPRVRMPIYGTAFALTLSTVLGLGIFFTSSPIAAPEIDDLEFAGDSAVVIESTTDPATLIWLNDAQDAEEEDEEDEGSDGEEL